MQDLHRDAPSRTACFGTVGSAHAFPRRHRSPKGAEGWSDIRACWPPGHQTNPDQRRIGAPSVPRWRPRHCGFAGPSPARHHHRPLFGHQEVGLCLSHGGIGVPKGPRGGPYIRACWPPGHQTNPDQRRIGAPSVPRWRPRHCGFAGPSPARHHHRPLFGHQEVGLCLSHGGIGVPKGPRGGPIYPRLLAAGAPNEPRSTPDRCPVGASMAP